MRLIDAERLDCVSWKDIPDGYKDTFVDGVRWILEQIDAQPTIEPQRKKGKWIDMNTPTTNYYPRYKCSACGNWSGMAKYCPNCGARMEEA